MQSLLSVTITLLFLSCAIEQVQSVANGPLTFRSEKNSTRHVFKLVQLADLHWGEAPGRDYGPEQDRKTARAIRTYFEIEQPDFVLLSGDQISSMYMIDNAREKHGEVIAAIKKAKPDVRWCTLMGNHDDHDYQMTPDDKKINQKPAKTSRSDLLKHDSKFIGSYTIPDKYSNYTLPLYLEDGTLAVDMYFFDTGGGGISKKLDESQVEWFKEESKLSPNEIARPIVAFQHIAARDGFKFTDNCGAGTNSKGKLSTIENKPGIMEALVQRKTHFLGVAHNHGNDYCCSNVEPLHLCFARHSGYGGRQWMTKGVRVYEMEILIADDKTRTFTWNSWVRLVTGEKTGEYGPGKSYEYMSPKSPVMESSNTLSETPEMESDASLSVDPVAMPSEVPSMSPTLIPTPMPMTDMPSVKPSFWPTPAPTEKLLKDSSSDVSKTILEAMYNSAGMTPKLHLSFCIAGLAILLI